MNISPLLSVNTPCNDALQWARDQLGKFNLRMVQTFDLDTARASLSECECPNHGTDACDCKMMVLLVYGETLEPVTLFLHGNDGKTWFSIAEDPRQRVDAALLRSIQQALENKKTALVLQK